MPANPADVALLEELTPEAERLMERHLSASKEWFPHEYVPWSQGRDFEPGEAWVADDEKVPAALRSALFVNLLTEDNLPYYFRDIERMFGRNDVWGAWSKRWTAEEGRHSIVIRDYLTVTRAIDPIELERARMIQVSKGEVPEPPSAADGMAYVALQELATRIAHFNTGELLEDDGYAQKIMKRVAADENLHYLFYRDLVSAAIKADPSAMVIAIEAQVRDFEMPGTGIPGFSEHARAIAKARIYDMQIHHEKILVPVVLRHWAVESLEGLTPEAEQARDALIDRIERTGRVAAKVAERAARDAARVSVSA
ncbi:MAG TPA: acyl-ACP desaturase [Acidimicrobiales bacterium]|nr:acyl-ACP desaturase [Acidimicrobiales bacterium]